MKKQEILECLLVVIIGIVTSIIPFIIFNATFFPFITGKNFVFRILVEIAGVLALCLFARGKCKLQLRNPIFIALSVFTGLATVSTLFSVDPFRSFWSNFERMEGLVTYLHFFVYVSLLLFVVKSKMWTWVWSSTLAGSVAMCFFSLYQILGYTAINQGGIRVDGRFGNAIYLAVYMLFNMFITLLLLRKSYFEKVYTSLVLPSAGFVASIFLFLYHVGKFHSSGGTSKISVVFVSGLIALLVAGAIAICQYFFYKKSKDWYSRIFFIALFLFQGIVLFYTGTRGAILGLGIGLFAGAIFALLSQKGQMLDRKVGKLIVCLGLLSVLSFFAFRSLPSITNHPVFGRVATVSFGENTVKARFLIWGMAVDGIKENPVLGWGLEGFRNVFDKYYDPRMYAQEQWFDRTHNLYLDWAVSGGVLGLASYLSLFGVLLWILFKKREILEGEAAILFGLTVAYMVHNMFVFDNISSLILFGLLLAYVGGMWLESSSEVRNVSVSLRVYGQVCAVVIGVFLVGVNLYQIRANTLLISALQQAQVDPAKAVTTFQKVIQTNSFGKIEAREQLVQFALGVATSNLPIEVKQEIGNFVASEVMESMKAQPNDARTWLFASILWRQFGKLAEAQALIEKALVLSPNKQTLRLELVNLLIAQKKYEEANKIAKETFELDKAFDEARIMYASTLIYADKKGEAKTILNERYGQLVADNRLVRAYIETKNYSDALAPLVALSANDQISREQSVLLSSIYFESGKRAESIAELKKVAKRFPEIAKDIDVAISEINAGRNPFK